MADSVGMLFAFMWREFDRNLRWFQPYIVLQKGNVVAEESVLIDYISLGPFLSLFPAMQYKHRVVFWSSFIAMLTYLFQPLTGSIFQIQQTLQSKNTVVTEMAKILDTTDFSTLNNPTLNDFTLNAFMAAAGYVDASVVHGLDDPPFVLGPWAASEFTLPEWLPVNGTFLVNTTGLQSNVNCSNPSEQPIVTPTEGANFTLSSKSMDGCVHNVTFDSNVTTHGVEPVPCPGNAASLDVQFQPVMFWYYLDSDSGSQVKTVFCTPNVVIAEIQILANLSNGVLAIPNQIGDEIVTKLDVTSGGVLNGLIFDVTDPFTQACANAIRLIVPRAIYIAAQLLSGNGTQSAFDLPNGFLNLTSTLYTRHLSSSAKAIYFVNENKNITGTVVSIGSRLKVLELPAHFLSLILATVGIFGVLLHIIHRRARENLLLAAPPGSIASVVALTSHSGFGELLLPYDDELTMKKKLDGLRFRLDGRTGAIVADSHVTDGAMADEGTPLRGDRVGMLDIEHPVEESSSQMAAELPRQRSWEPPGMSPLQQYSNTEYVL